MRGSCTWITVSPTATKTYTLTAASPYGTVTRGVTVAVNAIPPAPTISSFTASSSTLTVGQSALLSWSVAGADSLTLNGSPVTGTSITVTPSGTMTYTLVALNGGGQAQRSVKITVPNPEPPLAWVSDAVYGWGQLILEKRGAQAVYQQGDHLGTPSVLTNASGTVIGRQKSLPFGDRMVGSGAKSLRRFTNHEDGNQFPVYMQARMYLPTYGRFAQVDPAYDHSADGLNLYSYVSNEPVTRTDPDGMRDVGGIFGGGGGGDQWTHVPQDLRADMWAGEFAGLDLKFAGDLGIEFFLTRDGVWHYADPAYTFRREEKSAASETNAPITLDTINRTNILNGPDGALNPANIPSSARVLLLLGLTNDSIADAWQAVANYLAAHSDYRGSVLVALNDHDVNGVLWNKVTGGNFDPALLAAVQAAAKQMLTNARGQPVAFVGHSDGTSTLDRALGNMGSELSKYSNLQITYFGSPQLWSAVANGVTVNWVVRNGDPVTWLGSFWRIGCGDTIRLSGSGHNFSDYLHDAGGVF